MPVYFARTLEGPDRVKVGHSKMPRDRLQQLLKQSPVDLEIVAVYPGDKTTEARFHRLFREHHSHKEWFHAVEPVDQVLRALRAGLFCEETLPERGWVPRERRKKPWTDRSRMMTNLNSRVNKAEIPDLHFRWWLDDADLRKIWEQVEAVAPQPDSISSLYFRGEPIPKTDYAKQFDREIAA